MLSPDFRGRAVALQSDCLDSCKLGRSFQQPSAMILISPMIRRALLLIFCCCLPRAWGQSAKELAVVVGSWQGESKCMVSGSPCHDEQVLYQISTNRKDPDHLNLDAYKIVDGAPDFMGTLACQYRPKQSSLSCTADTSKQDDWEFHVFGDSMSGTLKIEGGKLYRVIKLRKAKDK